MRTIAALLPLLSVLFLTANSGVCQTSITPPSSVDPDLPWGGIAMSSGSMAPPGTPVPPAGSGACPAGDPCVLTGQNNQHRNSTNGNASNLGKMAGSGDYSGFG